MDRVAEFMNSLVVPPSLRGVIRNYIVNIRSGYQEIGGEPKTSCWIKLFIYLGSIVAIIGSIVAFAYGYIIIPAVGTSTAVICAVLFWFRDSIIWTRLFDCSRTVCCFPCNYFRRPISPGAEIRYERRLRQLLFGSSVGVQTDGPEAKSEAETEGTIEGSEAQSPSLEQSSESESSITMNIKSVKVQTVTEN